MAITPRYLDTEHAAEYLGYGTGLRGQARVRVLVHRRQIPFSKIGTTLRFDRQELDKFMAARTVDALPQQKRVA